jgi:hypothetical protein
MLMCHYACLIPTQIECYHKELDSAERLAHVRPIRVLVAVGELMEFAVFGIPGDGNCLFSAADMACKSRSETYQAGGVDYPELPQAYCSYKSLSHHKTCSSSEVHAFIKEKITSTSPVQQNRKATSFTTAVLTAVLQSASKRTRMPGINGDAQRMLLLDYLKFHIETLKPGPYQVLTEEMRIRARDFSTGAGDIVPEGAEPAWHYYKTHIRPLEEDLPCAVGSEFELDLLAQGNERPFAVFAFETPAPGRPGTFTLRHLYGMGERGLPVFLGLLNPLDAHSPRYVLLIPTEVEQYRPQLDAAERLVHVHATRVLVDLGVTMEFALFGIDEGRDDLFDAVDLAIKSGSELYQAGGVSYQPLRRHKDLSLEVQDKCRATKLALGYDKGYVREIRNLAATGVGGHAFSESSCSSIVKMSLIAADFGVGPCMPKSVVLDTGSGCGAILLFQGIVGADDVVAIGTEEDTGV